jgi:hypothetical protein
MLGVLTSPFEEALMEGHAGTAVRGNRSSPPALRDRADHGESRGLVDPGVMNPEVRAEDIIAAHPAVLVGRIRPVSYTHMTLPTKA